jgi:hypothetical protein
VIFPIAGYGPHGDEPDMIGLMVALAVVMLVASVWAAGR